jgi:hypothetical protein
MPESIGANSTIKQLLAVLSGVFLATAIAACVSASFDSTLPREQGCVNQGNDRRLMPLPVCWAQRHLSWRSDEEPYFVSFGDSGHMNVGLAWPPYLVVNWPAESGQWGMFRIGIRYDRNWRGYIFPTLALKVVSVPLRY